MLPQNPTNWCPVPSLYATSASGHFSGRCFDDAQIRLIEQEGLKVPGRENHVDVVAMCYGAPGDGRCSVCGRKPCGGGPGAGVSVCQVIVRPGSVSGLATEDPVSAGPLARDFVIDTRIGYIKADLRLQSFDG